MSYGKLAAILASGVCIVSLATPATAQVRTFKVPAGTLKSALDAYGRQAGRPIIYRADQVRGVRSRGATGSMSADAALDAILAGTSLRAQADSTGAVAIVGVGNGNAGADAGETTTGQEAAAAGDIVVTARKREERAIDVPIAITAVAGQTLERRGANNLADFLQEAPGVGIVDNGNGQSRITIRGVSALLGGNANGYYLDDLPFTGVTVPLTPDVRAWDLDRVEVLRGPQGTLFGEGSEGGTIRILTRGADLDDWEAKGSAYLSGTDGGGTNRGIKGAFNAPIIPGVLAVRVAGTGEKLPGWIDNATTGERDVNDQSYTTFRAKARFDPTDRLSINGSYWYYNADIPGGGAAADDNDQRFDVGLLSNTRYRLYGASARYDFGDAEAFYGYSHNVFDLNQSGPLFGGTLVSTINIKVDAHEARLASKGSGPFQWTVGGYIRDAKRADTLIFAIFGLNSDSSTTSNTRALFGEGTYTLPFAPIDLTAGLRYYRERLSGLTIDSGVSTDQPGGRYTSWNPRFSVAWHPNRDATIYASAAKGFRAGQLQSTAALAVAAPLGITLPVLLKQDTIWTYEVGTKAQLFDRMLTVEGAIYYSDWKDVPVPYALGSTGLSGSINSNGTHTKGVELSAVLHPVTGFSLSASGSYNDATYSETVPGSTIVGGTPVDFVAKFTANASADYRHEFNNDVSGFGRVGWQHSSPRRTDSFIGTAPGDTIDRVDARLGVDLREATIAVFADNLTNDNGAVDARSSLGAGGVRTATRLRPRTIGLELTAHFGGSVR